MNVRTWYVMTSAGNATYRGTIVDDANPPTELHRCNHVHGTRSLAIECATNTLRLWITKGRA